MVQAFLDTVLAGREGWVHCSPLFTSSLCSYFSPDGRREASSYLNSRCNCLMLQCLWCFFTQANKAGTSTSAGNATANSSNSANQQNNSKAATVKQQSQTGNMPLFGIYGKSKGLFRQYNFCF